MVFKASFGSKKASTEAQYCSHGHSPPQIKAAHCLCFPYGDIPDPFGSNLFRNNENQCLIWSATLSEDYSSDVSRVSKIENGTRGRLFKYLGFVKDRLIPFYSRLCKNMCKIIMFHLKTQGVYKMSDPIQKYLAQILFKLSQWNLVDFHKKEWKVHILITGWAVRDLR